MNFVCFNMILPEPYNIRNGTQCPFPDSLMGGQNKQVLKDGLYMLCCCNLLVLFCIGTLITS